MLTQLPCHALTHALIGPFVKLLQKATVAEISAVTGGGRLLAALASAELAAAETLHGPEARIDLDILWIFIGEVRCSRADGKNFTSRDGKACMQRRTSWADKPLY